MLSYQAVELFKGLEMLGGMALSGHDLVGGVSLGVGQSRCLLPADQLLPQSHGCCHALHHDNKGQSL